MNWQPIETAPKDGTAILTYSMDAMDDGRPYPMLIVAYDMPWEWTIFSEDGTTQTGTDYEPTHWAPLPPPPHKCAAQLLRGNKRGGDTE